MVRTILGWAAAAALVAAPASAQVVYGGAPGPYGPIPPGGWTHPHPHHPVTVYGVPPGPPPPPVVYAAPVPPPPPVYTVAPAPPVYAAVPPPPTVYAPGVTFPPPVYDGQPPAYDGRTPIVVKPDPCSEIVAHGQIGTYAQSELMFCESRFGQDDSPTE